MTAELPTEEDVLAFLVLNVALGELCFFNSADYTSIQDAISSWRASTEWSTGLEAVAHERLTGYDRIHAAAIADSERRLEVERARAEVVEAACYWDGTGDAGGLVRRLRDLYRAEAEVSRHGG